VAAVRSVAVARPIPVTFVKFLLILFGVVGSGLVAAEGTPNGGSVIVDTDAGPDDLMAIAYLLARDDVTLEAVIISPGLAHREAGADNVLRLLELPGRRDIPVYKGRATPLEGRAEFPPPWRKLSDELPGITLPTSVRRVEQLPGADYLARRLNNTQRPRPRLLALGALTTIAEVVGRSPELIRAVQELVIMGGAVRVPGNLSAGADFKTDNHTAEWNIFVDPAAADIVFRSGIKILLVPLDATNHVPITAAFVQDFRAKPLTVLGKFIAEVFTSIAPYVEQNVYYAWDPLAAVALTDREVVHTESRRIVVRRQPPESGRTAEATDSATPIEVAFDADASVFQRRFSAAFHAPGPR
jgi:pyrimidine-specific ribonucleoside hydrolase